MNKKELLASPDRINIDKHYTEIYIIPNGKMHESGFGYISIIGAINPETTLNNETNYELCGSCDDISCFFPIITGNGYEFNTVRMDCLYPSGILRYHGSRGYFTVSDALSSMNITFHYKE